MNILKPIYSTYVKRLRKPYGRKGVLPFKAILHNLKDCIGAYGM